MNTAADILATVLLVWKIMSIMTFRFFALLLPAVLSLATIAATAKILPQKPVVPVESNGVRYSAEEAEFVAATEIATGRQLWRVRVFNIHIKPWLEPDVQFVFITEIKLIDGALLVRDGRERCYAIDVSSHRIRKVACSNVFAEQDSSRH
jgi:hypothetical protein